jgi:hypothetical protein
MTAQLSGGHQRRVAHFSIAIDRVDAASTEVIGWVRLPRSHDARAKTKRLLFGATNPLFGCLSGLRDVRTVDADSVLSDIRTAAPVKARAALGDERRGNRAEAHAIAQPKAILVVLIGTKPSDRPAMLSADRHLLRPIS